MGLLQITLLLLAVLALVLALIYGVFRMRPSPRAVAQAAPARAATAPAVPATHDEPAAEMNSRLEIMQRLRLLALEPIAPASDAEAALHDEIASKIRWTLASIADKPTYAPRRPLLLPKLVQAMNDDDVSRRELASIIGSDPSLAGSLFRLANSPFYRLSSAPIENLDRAVALIGIEGMRSLVAAALMQPVFKIDGSGFPKFGDVTWQHTLCSATAAESHAVMIESSDPFAAQLLALLMGMATIIVFRVALDEYQSRKLSAHHSVIASLIDSQAAPVARQVAMSWQLSERIDTALADQSGPQESRMSSLGRSLQVGRFLGALAVLHERQIIDDEAVSSALRSGGSQAPAYERIWAKRQSLQTEGRR